VSGAGSRHGFAAAFVLACLAVAPASPRPAREVVPFVAADSIRAATRIAAARALPADDFAPGRFVAANGAALPYRLLAPESPAPGQRYPLVVFLHGSGAIGTDDIAQLGAFARSWALPGVRRRFAAYVLAPQFPERSAEYATDPADSLPCSRPGAPLLALPELLDSLQSCLPIDARRLYLSGFSMGASSAWQMLLLRPGRFAAAVLVAGVPPERAAAGRIGRTPVLVLQGTADEPERIGATQAMVRALQARAGSPVRLREYERVGHAIPPELFLSDHWRTWLFAQRR
jgi:predicted peptidase